MIYIKKRELEEKDKISSADIIVRYINMFPKYVLCGKQVTVPEGVPKSSGNHRNKCLLVLVISMLNGIRKL